MHNLGSKTIKTQIEDAFKLLRKQRKNEAQAIFFQFLDQAIDDVEDITQLGNLAMQLGEKVFAINFFAEVVQQYPENTVYLNNLAQAYIDNEMFSQAEEQLKKATDINPDFYLSYAKLGYIALKHGNFSVAVELLEKTINLKPGVSTAYINIISALNQTGRQEEAYQYAKKLLRLEPDMVDTYYLLGKILNSLGRFDEARSNFEKAIRLDRTFGGAYWELVAVKNFSSADNAFKKQAEKALQMSMPAERRAAIHFSLGKVYNDCKDWEKAFEHYKQANLICKPAIKNKFYLEIFNKTHKFFVKNLFQKTEKLGSNSEIPVFVVGMPRSGTTLIEQIIASHPDGGGAGELSVIRDINYRICPEEKLSDFKQELAKSLDKELLNEYIDTYLDVLCSTREDPRRIVDKMPENFIFLGLIHLLFPKAHIINAVRSPLDVCLSCYFQYFQSLDWSYDLKLIADQYKFYKKVMAYWKKVLPENSIIDVHYEKLTSDPEIESKKLIEGLGLQWDPSCLEFYKRKRAVNTASLWQVRQPVYTSSNKRWINYAQHLEALANELQEYLDEDDIEELKKRGIKLKKKWRLNILM